MLAGGTGLDRVVDRLNVIEVPDILPWVKPRELLLTTAYPLHEAPDELPGLVEALHERGLAGLAIKLGRYLNTLPREMLAVADDRAFPIVRLPDDTSFDDILNPVLTDILHHQAATLAWVEQVHSALLQIVLNGGGLAEVTHDVARLLDNTVIVTVAEGNIVAESRLEAVRERAEMSDIIRDGQLVDPLRRATTASRGTLQVLAAPIIAGSTPNGAIAVLRALERESDITGPPVTGIPAEEEHRFALETAATVAALVIVKDLAVVAVEAKFQSDFLHELFGNRVEDGGDIVTRASSFGWDLDRPFRATPGCVSISSSLWSSCACTRSARRASGVPRVDDY